MRVSLRASASWRDHPCSTALAGLTFGYLETDKRNVQLPSKKEAPMLKRVVIERDIPKAGAMNAAQLKEAACTSNDALAELAPKA